MTTMTSRERVLATIHHQEPDRVPVALGGGPYGIVDAIYMQLLDRFKLGEPVAPFRQGHNISYLDDRVFDLLGIDTRYVWPGASPTSPSHQTDAPDTFLDSFGQVWKQATPYYYADTGILNSATSIDQIDAIVTWPDVTDSRWTQGVAERAQYLRANTDNFIIARMIMSHGVFQSASDLRGTSEFMMDMMLNEPFARHLIDRITATIDGLIQGYLDSCGNNIDMIELPGDDFASNTNLLLSPEMFRSFIKPSIQQFIATIRSFNPDIKIMLHSDGLITKLLPEFADLGIDVLHPLEPVDALDQHTIKAEWGDTFTFLGGIDISHAMPGTVEDVRSEVALRLRELGPGGGYILAPSNHLQADVPPENVIALFEAAREFGQYPIKA